MDNGKKAEDRALLSAAVAGSLTINRSMEINGNQWQSIANDRTGPGRVAAPCATRPNWLR
jgi:hypothetical protein